VAERALARQVERAGFRAVYISGAGSRTATAGVPDIGLLTLTEVAQLAGYIAKAVDIRRSWMQIRFGWRRKCRGARLRVGAAGWPLSH